MNETKDAELGRLLKRLMDEFQPIRDTLLEMRENLEKRVPEFNDNYWEEFVIMVLFDTWKHRMRVRK